MVNPGRGDQKRRVQPQGHPSLLSTPAGVRPHSAIYPGCHPGLRSRSPLPGRRGNFASIFFYTLPVRAPVFLFLLILTALRLAFVGQLELSPDEAYYQMWSERLDWAYFSKGPGVALAIRAGTELFGTNEFGVRFLAPILALGTSLLLWALARRMFGAGAAAWTVLALNLTPLFTAGSLLMTIDPLSVFFWAAGMLAAWRAVQSGGSAANVGWWALAGLAVGLGLLCKYTNAAELLSFALALALVPRWRREFRRAGFYLAVLVTATCALPALWWMREHDWVTLEHLGARGGFEESFQLAKAPGEFGKWLLGLVGVYGPLVFLAMVAALGWASRRARRAPAPEAERTRFLLAFALPLLVGYGVLAFKTAGEPNWTAPAFLAVGVLAGGCWHGWATRSRPARAFALAALVTSAAVSLFALNTDLVRAAGAPLSYHKEPTARLYGWRAMAEGVAETRRTVERETGAPVFLVAAKYGTAAELNFYLPADARRVDRPGHPAVYLPESQSFESQFSFWPSYAELPLTTPDDNAPALPADDAKMTAEAEFAHVGANPYAGRSALFIVEGDRGSRPPSSVEGGFERIEAAGRYEVRRWGRDVRVFQVFRCSNYQGAEL